MENKYPYIGQSDVTGNVVLLTSQGCGYFIECDRRERVGRLSGKIHETYFKNIISDYLRNTKIRIESPEHSAFVQKLVFGAGGDWFATGKNTIQHTEMPFLIIDEYLLLSYLDYPYEHIFDCCEGKEIKPPMPPSKLPEVSSETPMPKVKPPKQASDEWPKVGDEIVTIDCKANKADYIKPNVKGIVLTGEFKGEFCVKLPCGFEVMDRSQFEKPLTKQEKLARLIHTFGGTDANYCENLAKAILAGEIEGLVYKGD